MSVLTPPGVVKAAARDQKFFEFNKLSPQMKARIPAAKAEFESIQRVNLEKEKAQLRAEGKLTAEAEAQLEEKYRRFKPDEYSKLFYRILSGDKALDKPPPRVFGYPSYELVERGFSMVSEFGGLRQDAKGPWLVINGERWPLLYMNAEGKKVLAYERFYRKVSERGESAKWDDYLDLSRLSEGNSQDPKELLWALLCQQANAPRFVVEDPNWGPYELSIGRAWMVGDLAYEADQVESLGRDPRGRFLATSFATVNTNLKVEVRSKDGVTEQEWVTLALDSWLLTRTPDWRKEQEAA